VFIRTTTTTRIQNADEIILVSRSDFSQ